MEPTPDDKLAASVFALGLSAGFVRREDVVRWADRRIAEGDVPPPWLIDLSLSEGQHLLDVVGDLKRLAEDAGPVVTCEAAYALLPDVAGYSFARAAALAKRVYRITYERLGGDWSQPLLATTDRLADDFDFLRDGYLNSTEQAVVGAFQQFVEDHRVERLVRLLLPVRWATEDEDASEPAARTGPLVHVALSSWIVQDGNYGDFSVGQEARFALEFYPPNGLRPVQDRPPHAQHLGDSRYRVVGQVVYVGPDAWVIDVGSVMVFREESPPAHAVVGQRVEGEVYVGIDPFFYFERLHGQPGMPPLTYPWVVRQVLRQTTPWVETRNAIVQRCRARDESRRSFVSARETRAWTDDDGHGDYVLVCERTGGPTRPSGEG